MFRKYGLLGIVLMAAALISVTLKIPLVPSFFAAIWYGYILVVDAVVHKIQHNSLISNRPAQFLSFIFLSAVFWWLFELLNISTQNWSYVVGGRAVSLFSMNFISVSVAFSTVLPAVMETTWLVKALHLFDNVKLKKEHRITKSFLYAMMSLGIFSLVAPLLQPSYFYPLLWVSFFFLLDPINYLHGQPSIIGHLKDRRLKTPLSLLTAGYICGFFWEFWNSIAMTKWTYTIPLVGFLKIFEMPLLGYLGYGPFAWSLYAMWKFARGLWEGKK